jgi:hypothetical protein
MLKFIKEGKSMKKTTVKKLSEPSTSKAEKEVADTIIRLHNSYLAMRFIWTGDENCPLPLRTVCGKN